jgi:hypothetical protein
VGTALTFVRLALALDVAALAVGLTFGGGSPSLRLQGAVLAVLIYGCLAWWSAPHTKRVAVAVLVLSVVAAATNLVSPDAVSLVVGSLSSVSAASAVAALAALRHER